MRFSSFRSRRPGRRSSCRGLTLVEVIVSSGILALLMAGVFASLLQARRVSEAAIDQNSALAIVQGYVEQIKNMEFADLPYTTSTGTLMAGGGSTADQVTTRLDEVTLDPLRISTAAVPALATIGITSANTTGIVDNIKVIDMNRTGTTTDDLTLNVRLWIQDISDASINATQVRAITVHYAWRIGDGSRFRVSRGAIRTIRSSVPTF